MKPINLQDIIKQSDMVKLLEKGKAKEVPFGNPRQIYEVEGKYYIYRQIGKHYERLGE
jgi:hypothetical protein